MSDKKELVSESVPEWQLELDRVGFLRRILLARKWYKGDWWFVLISGIMLLFIITVGIFPQWFPPHDPRERQAGGHRVTSEDSDRGASLT